MSAPTLTAEARRVLKALANGGRIEARKTPPFKHRFYLLPADTTGAGERLATATVTSLLGAGLIGARAVDPLADRIEYTITDAGRSLKPCAAGGAHALL